MRGSAASVAAASSSGAAHGTSPRSDAASTTCSPEMSGASSRSARVRATRRTRAAPRPVSVCSSTTTRHASVAASVSCDVPPERARGHVRVATPRRARGAGARCRSTAARTRVRDDGRGLARGVARLRARDPEAQVEAVEQRRGEAAAVAGPLRSRCSGRPRPRARTGTGSCTRRAGTRPGARGSGPGARCAPPALRAAGAARRAPRAGTPRARPGTARPGARG